LTDPLAQAGPARLSTPMDENMRAARFPFMPTLVFGFFVAR
jgi:hypothetical protein